MLSGTIGTDNIAGVDTTISMCGPDAFLWMWLTAVVGMATKFVECPNLLLSGIPLKNLLF
ncbi:MAG: alanine:cation symporter family protein [Methanosarcinales archaeon]|nr:alanine:cation symporter family protein [Methanosarcinales archaeon]